MAKPRRGLSVGPAAALIGRVGAALPWRAVRDVVVARPYWWGGLAVACLMVAIAAVDGSHRVEPERPAGVGAIEMVAGGVPAPRAEPPPGSPPVQPLAALEEPSPAGPLPIAASGASPMRAYVRAAERGDRPAVAIVVVDLGLMASLARSSTDLPEAVALAFSAHGDDVPAWQAFARSMGHETPLMLPVTAPPGEPVDAGPGALAPDQPDVAERLAVLLARGRGYPIVVLRAGAYAANPLAFVGIARELARRGLGLLELDGRALATVAGMAGLPYAATERRLDAVPDVLAVDAELGQLEAAALRDGLALAYTEPYPGVFDRIWLWHRELAERGIDLVPLSLAYPIEGPA